MKKLVMVAAVLGLGISGVALAKGPMKSKTQVTERDAKGRPTKVMMDGKEYAVCTSDNSDGCINPREAGLGFGNNTAKTWPGKPISRDN